MPVSNYDGGFAGGVTIRGMPILNQYAGQVFWVNSSKAGASDGNKGTFDRPLSTLDKAFDTGFVTADRGDVVMVGAGHSETSLSASIAADVSGCAVVGLGVGDTRPTFGGIATDEVIHVTADDVGFRNLQFNALTSGTQAGTRKFTIEGENCAIEACRFECGASDDDAIYVDVLGDDCFIYDNQFYVTADGPDTAITLEGADGGNTLQRTIIKNNFFNGNTAANSWDEGIIYSSGVHTECLIEDNRFLFMSGGVGGVEFTAAATGIIAGNYFAGGTLGAMLDPGSCYCFQNYEADAIDESGREFPTSTAS